MRVGFVAVVGRPNVGKSTLLNKIVESKISITTATPQTTRHQIKAIYNDNESQIIFIDTPGIHKPQQKLGIVLNKKAFRAIQEADFILFLTPIDDKIGPGDKFIIEMLPKHKSAAVITKVDKGTIKMAVPKTTTLKKLGFGSILSTTFKSRSSIKTLIQFLKANLPTGPLFFNANDTTDVSTRFLIQENIRETIIEKTRDELPHVVKVVINDLVVKQGHYHVDAIINVERNSQKHILIGKHGLMIKTIGTIARKKIEKIVGKRLFLALKVKVDRNWTNDQQKIIKSGF